MTHPNTDNFNVNRASKSATKRDREIAVHRPSEDEDQLTNIDTVQLLNRLPPPGHPDRVSSVDHLAQAVWIQFGQTRDLVDLDKAVLLHELALELRPPSHPERCIWLNNVGATVLTRFRETGRSADLDKAVQLHEQAVELYPPDHHDLRADALQNLAAAVYIRFAQREKFEDLDKVILLNEQVLALRPPGHPNRYTSLSNLASATFTRGKKLGQTSDLDKAELLRHQAFALRPPSTQFERSSQPPDLDEQVLELCPPDHPDRGTFLGSLAGMFHKRFEDSSQLTDLDKAVLLYEQTLEFHPPGHPRRFETLSNLASAIHARFLELREPGSDLDTAVAMQAQALKLFPPGHSSYGGALLNLASTLRTRFEESSQITDLDHAVLLNEQALELHPPGHPYRSTSLGNFANAMGTRFEHSNQLTDLDKAVLLHEQSLELRSPGHPNRSAALGKLGKAMRTRFKATGKLEDLDGAILHLEHAVSLRSPDCRDRAILDDLGLALSTRFGRTGQLSDLDEAVQLHEQALELSPSRHPDRSISLSNLANCFSIRFKITGKLTDMEQAGLMYEQNLALCPPGHRRRPSILDDFGLSLKELFQVSGKLDDLNRAVELQEEALATFAPHDPQYLQVLNNLAISLLRRFEQSGQPTDLNKAIQLVDQARELRPTHHQISTLLHNAATMLQTRFRQSGDLIDLDRAVLLHEQALELHLPGHPHRPASLDNLASSIRTRFEQSGQLTDMDKAVRLHEQALELFHTGNPARSSSLSNLAAAVQRRFQHSGTLADANLAVRLLEEALELVPPHHHHHFLFIDNLASAFYERFTVSRQLADLDKTVVLRKQALNIFPMNHPNRPASLLNTATTLLKRSQQSQLTLKAASKLDEQVEQSEESKWLSDLDQAISLCRDGLQSSSDTHRIHSNLYLILGCVYAAKFGVCSLPSDLDNALDALARGAEFEFGLLEVRFEAAVEWTDTAIKFGRFGSAVTASGVAIALLPRLFWLRLDFRSRLDALKRAPGLVSDGAASAVRESKVMEAVELLERGRGVFWTHSLQLRTEFDRLPLEFAQKFTRISCELQTVTVSDASLSPSVSVEMSAEETVRRRELNDEWLQALKEIRRTPGFEHFLLPKPFANLAVASLNGPVVILIASRVQGCHAIVIESPVSPAMHLSLPGMTFKKLESLRTRLHRSTWSDQPRHMAQYNGPNGRNEKFGKMLEALWMSVAKPVIDCLGLKKSDNPKRLWWCPTSLFMFMPIHAAGFYDAPDSLNMSDFAVSSYTPTLDTLITAQARAASAQSDKVLVIIQPNTPGQLPLRYTVEERNRIRKVVPSASFLQLHESSAFTTDGSDATVENVIARLPEASIVHFACHGAQSSDPLESALLLQDGGLTLSRLMHQELPNASIAFLSACHSAAGDEQQPDEIVHLAAGMLAAGFPSVIATMWSMGDKDGPVVSEEVYTKLFNPRPDPSHAAFALHVAVRKLRATGVKFTSWVPFIHLGV